MTAPRRTAILALVVAAGVLVAAFLGLRGSRSGDMDTPPRIWTRDPLPTLAALRAAPRPLEADVRTAPDGSRVRGFDAVFAPRFGPQGGPEILWELALLPSRSAVDAVLDRFRDDAEISERIEAVLRHPPTYADVGVAEEREGAVWRSWDLRTAPADR